MNALNPAVRQWLYGVVTALVPILIVYGVLDHHEIALWLALAAAVLGTGTATVFTNTGRGTDAYVGRRRRQD